MARNPVMDGLALASPPCHHSTSWWVCSRSTFSDPVPVLLFDQERWLLEEIEALMAVMEEETDAQASASRRKREVVTVVPAEPTTAELREYKGKLAEVARQREHEAQVLLKLGELPSSSSGRKGASNLTGRGPFQPARPGERSPREGGEPPRPQGGASFRRKKSGDGLLGGTRREEEGASGVKGQGRVRDKLQAARDEQFLMP